MSIKQIFDEIANESSTKQKMFILGKYKENELLKRVLYMANSKRVKFYIKQIPPYSEAILTQEISKSLDALASLSDRTLTGHSAVNHLSSVLSLSNFDDAYVIERIIEKDCRIGMAASNINKVIPGLIEETPYMGAKSFDKKLVEKLFEKGGKAYSQIKMDGRYCNAIIRSGEVELESRQGEPTIIGDTDFVKELKKFNVDCVLNGELTIDGVSRYESNGMISSIISINKKIADGEDVKKDIEKFEEKHIPLSDALKNIRFTVWDILDVEEYFEAKSNRPYHQRFSNLNVILTEMDTNLVSIVESRDVSSYKEAMEHFTEIAQKGEEGTILKSNTGTWKDGKPNWQVKFKKEINLDLKITGFKYGTGKNEHVISSISVESSDGLLKTMPTGMKEDVMEYVTDNQENLLDKILEIKCSGVSKDEYGNYSVLHPVFKLIRDDKSIANSLNECIEIDKASVFL